MFHSRSRLLSQNQNNMLHKSTKIIATISFLILAGSLTIFGGFGFVIFTQKQNYIDLYRQNELLKNQESSINALLAELETTKGERESLESRILADEEVIDFLALIETLGREQQVKLTTSGLSVQPINATFETLVVRMEVEGGYDSVLRTLKLMEQLPYQTVVSNSQLNSGSGDVWKGVFEIQLTKFKKI